MPRGVAVPPARGRRVVVGRSRPCTGGDHSDAWSARFRASRKCRTKVFGAVRILRRRNEAHLSAEEAEAGQDPRIPRTDEHPWRPRDPQAPAPQRPEAPHGLDGGEATPASLAQRRVRPRLSRRLIECDPLPRALHLPAQGRGRSRREARRIREPQDRRRGRPQPGQEGAARSLLELAERLPAKYDFVLVARPDIAELIEREGTAGVTTSIEEALAGTSLTERST